MAKRPPRPSSLLFIEGERDRAVTLSIQHLRALAVQSLGTVVPSPSGSNSRLMCQRFLIAAIPYVSLARWFDRWAAQFNHKRRPRPNNHNPPPMWALVPPPDRSGGLYAQSGPKNILSSRIFWYGLMCTSECNVRLISNWANSCSLGSGMVQPAPWHSQTNQPLLGWPTSHGPCHHTGTGLIGAVAVRPSGWLVQPSCEP